MDDILNRLLVNNESMATNRETMQATMNEVLNSHGCIIRTLIGDVHARDPEQWANVARHLARDAHVICDHPVYTWDGEDNNAVEVRFSIFNDDGAWCFCKSPLQMFSDAETFTHSDGNELEQEEFDDARSDDSD